jgi:hypothetical protein
MKERDSMEDPSVDGRIVLKWVLNKQGGRVQTQLIWKMVMNLQVS